MWFSCLRRNIIIPPEVILNYYNKAILDGENKKAHSNRRKTICNFASSKL